MTDFDCGEFIIECYENDLISYETAHAMILKYDPIYETELIAAQALREAN